LLLHVGAIWEQHSHDVSRYSRDTEVHKFFHYLTILTNATL